MNIRMKQNKKTKTINPRLINNKNKNIIKLKRSISHNKSLKQKKFINKENFKKIEI